jgi:hypothetical protein
MKSAICLWYPVCKRITMHNRTTGQEMEGVITKHSVYGEIINWPKNSGPIVPKDRLYPSYDDAWAIKLQHKREAGTWERQKYKIKGKCEFVPER